MRRIELTDKKKGYLLLENGDIFKGSSFGSIVDVSGEVVFNTGMVGYPEGFTDPSYCGQILTMTYPLIGNYGVPADVGENGIKAYLESDKIQIKGLIVSSYIADNNHWQSERTLSSWLRSEGIPALSGIDTRTLTKTLREFGVMKGIITFNESERKSGLSFYDVNQENVVEKVSCSKPITYGNGRLKILLIDCGVKLNQIRMLLCYNTTVIRVPWNFDPFNRNNQLKFDAIFISNGPGDPKMVPETITITKKALEAKIPTLGVCLGNQILALSAGADTYKLKYGHRGQNQPVKDEVSNKCYITSQNHGFSVSPATLPMGWKKWFTNLNDNTCEGIYHTKLPFFSAQFHPESSPGPTDTGWIFDYFISETIQWLKKN